MSRTLNIPEKQCLECGKVFKPKNGFQKYCPGPHYTRCVICGKTIEYTCSPKEKPKYCSQTCINEGKRRNVRAKYGVDNVSELSSVRRKISERNSSEEVSKKRKLTCLEKYGVDNPAKNLDIRKKMIAVMTSDEYLDSRKSTCLQKYGFDSPMKNPDVKKKKHDTCMERYNTGGRPQTESDYKAKMVDPSKYRDYMSFKQNSRLYIQSHYKTLPSISDLKRDLGVTDTPIYDILVAQNSQDMILHVYSSMENEMYEFLKSLDPSMIIIRNDRTQIKPLELDFYLPEYRFAIECNPASTHNSTVEDAWAGTKKSYRYHQIKSEAAEQAGIFLFHVFGYEWRFKKSIIQSMIRNALKRNSRSIGARSTCVVNLSSEDCNKFLDDNHRQGATAASIRLGLRLKTSKELVSVMTFNKMKRTMGAKSADTENTWELSRFCSLLDTNVTGGASKLFKHFLNSCQFDRIVSFSDVAHTTGDMYRLLGFHKVSVSAPGYVWSDYYDTKYYNRVNCQKRFLRKLLNDDSIDLSTSEREIMEEHGFVRIYDSGVIRWEYYNEVNL